MKVECYPMGESLRKELFESIDLCANEIWERKKQVEWATRSMSEEACQFRVAKYIVSNECRRQLNQVDMLQHQISMAIYQSKINRWRASLREHLI